MGASDLGASLPAGIWCLGGFGVHGGIWCLGGFGVHGGIWCAWGDLVHGGIRCLEGFGVWGLLGISLRGSQGSHPLWASLSSTDLGVCQVAYGEADDGEGPGGGSEGGGGGGGGGGRRKRKCVAIGHHALGSAGPSAPASLPSAKRQKPGGSGGVRTGSRLQRGGGGARSAGPGIPYNDDDEGGYAGGEGIMLVGANGGEHGGGVGGGVGFFDYDDGVLLMPSAADMAAVASGADGMLLRPGQPGDFMMDGEGEGLGSGRLLQQQLGPWGLHAWWAVREGACCGLLLLSQRCEGGRGALEGTVRGLVEVGMETMHGDDAWSPCMETMHGNQWIRRPCCDRSVDSSLWWSRRELV